MAYRRRHSVTRTSTFEDPRSFPADDDSNDSPSIAAKAICASAAHRDSSLSSAYDAESAASNDSSASASASASEDSTLHHPGRRTFVKQGSNVYEYSSTKTSNPRTGFWDVLAKKAKAILEDDKAAEQFEENGCNPSQTLSSEHGQEGISIMENKTIGIIHEKKKLQIRRNQDGPDTTNPPADGLDVNKNQNDYEEKLNASKKVANAMAAKAKLILRELKTVKADLAFAKERCTQLEEENTVLRENRPKGDTPADDDLIRHQLETLLAEKARLAHENSVYALENRFLREIVEYHQLTMQDVVSLDDGIDEVTEVIYPIHHQTPNLSSPSRSAHHPSSPNTCISDYPNTTQRSSMDSVAPPAGPNSPTPPITTDKGSPSPSSQKAEGSMQRQHEQQKQKQKHISSAPPP